jgi:hypothetical protein
MSAPHIIDCEQGSALWQEVRCGLVTASRAADVIAMTKKGEAAARRDYRTEILCEILTGVPYPQFVTKEMIWGTEQEPFAIAAYEIQTGILVERVGFIAHGEISRFGCSPDGLVGDRGLVQVKCPTTATHLSWMLAGVVPIEHIPQLLAELSCTERDWVDFVSFDPRLPEHLQLFVRRFDRDPKLIATLEAEVVHFNEEIDQVLASLPGPQPAAKLLDWPHTDEETF